MTQDPRRQDPYPQDHRRQEEERRLKLEERRLEIARRNHLLQRVENAIYYLTGALLILLFLRLLLRLFGANPENLFARFIYVLSAPFVAPFTNLFSEPLQTLEINTLVAMVIYALLAWLVARLVWLIWGIEP